MSGRLREAEGTQPSHWLPFTSPQQNTAEQEKNTSDKNKREMEEGEIRDVRGNFQAMFKF